MRGAAGEDYRRDSDKSSRCRSNPEMQIQICKTLKEVSGVSELRVRHAATGKPGAADLIAPRIPPGNFGAWDSRVGVSCDCCTATTQSFGPDNLPFVNLSAQPLEMMERTGYFHFICPGQSNKTAHIVGSGWPATRFPDLCFLHLPGYDFNENVLQTTAGSKVLNVSRQTIELCFLQRSGVHFLSNRSQADAGSTIPEIWQQASQSQ